jgi:hypothetical protein
MASPPGHIHKCIAATLHDEFHRAISLGPISGVPKVGTWFSMEGSPHFCSLVLELLEHIPSANWNLALLCPTEQGCGHLPDPQTVVSKLLTFPAAVLFVAPGNNMNTCNVIPEFEATYLGFLHATTTHPVNQHSP